VKIDLWEANINGKKCADSFEISVVRQSNEHGHESYGWFGDNKLLISSSGGPCKWPVTEQVWDKLIEVAKETAQELNLKEFGAGHYKTSRRLV